LRPALLPVLALSALAASCALPAVSAGTFLPAGDLKRGDLHANISFEVARVLAGPTDVDASARAVPPGAQQWTVSTWATSDASVRWQAFDRLAFEAQLKLVNPVSPFALVPIGGGIGARLRLMDRGGPKGFALELGGRLVGIGVQQRLTRSQDLLGRQTDTWNYRSVGLEVPLIGSYRISPLVAVTASPFMRLYRIRAWHNVVAADNSVTTTLLPWTAVLTAGLGLSVAMDLGPVQLAPGLALELSARPGGDQHTSFLFEPGLAVGTRF
jgi:hypothetical protein